MARHLDLPKYRKLLEDEQRRVQGELDSLQSQDGGSSESGETAELTDFDQHIGDAGTETFLRERDQAIEGSEQTVLRLIEIALRKIDDGTYGICERCGEPITAARLEAIPYTPYCIKDAEWLEGR
jgi:DnaK suppressor protein